MDRVFLRQARGESRANFVIDMHTAFSDFESKPKILNPIWFSMVREPVERLISGYYYSMR
jgi:hypothetical protein